MVIGSAAERNELDHPQESTDCLSKAFGYFDNILLKSFVICGESLRKGYFG